MRKIACFFAVAACVACNYDVCDVSGEEQAGEHSGKLAVTIEYESSGTKALTDYTESLEEEDMVKTAAVLVFDKTTQKLNAYKTVESVDDECVFSVTTGEKIVYAVINAPDLSSVTTIGQLKQIVDNLSDTDIKEDGLVMVGNTDCVVSSGEIVEPTLVVKRLVARVVLQRITNMVAPQYGKIEVNCVYLGNANTVQTLDGSSTDMVNVDGYADSSKKLPIGKNGELGACPGYLYRAVGGEIAQGDSDIDKYHMYCQPASAEDETCMYVLATIGESQYYYRVPLTNGLQANKTYSVEIEIVNLGADLPPDGDVQKGEIKAVVSVSGWDAGESYVVEF